MKNETARREIESLDYYLQNHTNDYSEESHTAMMMAIDALSSSEKPNKWIPVSERLPEKDADVLAYVKGVGIVYQRVMWIDDYTSEWVGFAGSGYQDEVIAWMSLPEPYEPQERSDKE